VKFQKFQNTIGCFKINPPIGGDVTTELEKYRVKPIANTKSVNAF
jgi:hypothetical protein